MSTPAFHPDLRNIARVLPRSILSRRTLPILRAVGGLAAWRRSFPGLIVDDVHVPGLAGAPLVRVRTYRASSPSESRAPALLWIHGGGLVLGTPAQDDALMSAWARDLGLVVVSVEYRKAPEHPYPAPLDDCVAALRWLRAREDVDPARIVVGGASAGGGLAAALALRLHDEGAPPPLLQLLVYPMLDDRTAVRPDVDGARHRLWSQADDLFGWSAYLGRSPGDDDVPDHAAPARRADLRGLPRAWIGVGSCDLFHDEDALYARRLQEAGVGAELHIVDGAFHGFDAVMPRAPVARDFRAAAAAALRRALGAATAAR